MKTFLFLFLEGENGYILVFVVLLLLSYSLFCMQWCCCCVFFSRDIFRRGVKREGAKQNCGTKNYEKQKGSFRGARCSFLACLQVSIYPCWQKPGGKGKFFFFFDNNGWASFSFTGNKNFARLWMGGHQCSFFCSFLKSFFFAFLTLLFRFVFSANKYLAVIHDNNKNSSVQTE